MKKKYIILLIAILVLILSIVIVVKVMSDKDKLSNRICETIDNNCNSNGECVIKMDEITDFAWDKMLLYQVGASASEISEVLGVEFKYTGHISSGMVFVKDDEIIYHESFFWNPEDYPKLQIFVQPIPGEGEEYPVFTPDDAVLFGKRFEIDGKLRYYIKPYENNQ